MKALRSIGLVVAAALAIFVAASVGVSPSKMAAHAERATSARTDGG